MSELRNNVLMRSPDAPEEAVGGNEALSQSGKERLREVEQIRKLQQEIERLKHQLERRDDMERAIKNIHALFDHEDFFNLQNQLHLLSMAGIEGVKIRGAVHPLSDIKEKVDAAEQYTHRPLQDLRLDDSEYAIATFLAGIGVTRGKISERSLLGFRECLATCIEHALKLDARL